ncbi:MAG: agmatinase [Deltaproteobacteria bacterium]|jgi:agmatinase|nr:agmatinase [Deltaproteobacteria bacterium]
MTNFLGLTDEESSYQNSNVVVLPIPYEGTVSYGKGTSKAPRCIIEASTQVELYNEELGCEPFDVGVATLPELKLDGVMPDDLFREIVPSVTKLLEDGKWPLILGGEHSITPAAIKAYHDNNEELTVVQFDAHADLRSEYDGEAMSHACAMARAREMYPAVQVGIRNISAKEIEQAKLKDYSIFFARDMHRDDRWMGSAIDSIKTDKVYITLDLDAFDGSILPATGTPEPGGMNWWQVTEFLKILFEKKSVVGMDIVELAPIKGFHAYDFMVAKLAYKCIGYLRASKKKTN